MLIANVGVESQLQISVGSVSDVEFAGPAGERVFGSTTAARHLASLSPLADQLLGETAEQQAKVRLAPCREGGGGRRQVVEQQGLARHLMFTPIR